MSEVKQMVLSGLSIVSISVIFCVILILNMSGEVVTCPNILSIFSSIN